MAEVDIFTGEGRFEHGGIVTVYSDVTADEGVCDGFSGCERRQGDLVGAHVW